jgi:hypothetical protein
MYTRSLCSNNLYTHTHIYIYIYNKRCGAGYECSINCSVSVMRTIHMCTRVFTIWTGWTWQEIRRNQMQFNYYLLSYVLSFGSGVEHTVWPAAYSSIFTNRHARRLKYYSTVFFPQMAGVWSIREKKSILFDFESYGWTRTFSQSVYSELFPNSITVPSILTFLTRSRISKLFSSYEVDNKRLAGWDLQNYLFFLPLLKYITYPLKILLIVPVY